MSGFPSPILLSAGFFVVRRLLGHWIPGGDGKPASYATVRRDILARAIDPPSRVPCTVMDWRTPDLVFTLVVHPDASAVLYLPEQIGALGDPDGVGQGSARRFRAAVGAQEPEMRLARIFREPPTGFACFWIVTEHETLTSGHVPVEDIELRLSPWTAAWGSGMATMKEIVHSRQQRWERGRRQALERAAAGNVATGPRSV